MKTYDVYEIGYMGNMPNENLTNEEVFDLVTDKGDWDLVKTYANKNEALRMWNGGWNEMAYTQKDPFDDTLHYSVWILEESERNDDEEVVEHNLLDYAVEPFIKSQVKEWEM